MQKTDLNSEILYLSRHAADYPLLRTAGPAVVLALRSEDCNVIRLEKERWKRSPDYQTLTYEIEGSLPANAEHLAATIQRAGNHWLAIAVDTSLFPAITAAEHADRWIAGISPIVLLATQKHLDRLPKSGRVLVVWQEASALDLIVIENRQLSDWKWVPAAQGSVEEYMTLNGLEGSTVYLASFLDDELKTALRNRYASLTELDADVDRDAAEVAHLIVDGRISPWWDLAVGPWLQTDPWHPIRGPLNVLFMAFVLVAFLSILGMYWRGQRYATMIEQAEERQARVFRELFPNQPLPVGMRTRMESEFRRLQATKGDSGRVPRIPSVVPVLHAFLSSQPETNRYRWERLELRGDRIHFATGAAKTFADYEAVGEAMRVAGFEIPPLSAVQSGSGVTMRLEEITRAIAKPELVEPVPLPEAPLGATIP